jgi:glutamate dehydrogenase
MLAAEASGQSVETAARLYFRLGERLALARLGGAAQKLPREGQWPSQAATAISDELATLQADLLGSVLRTAPGESDPGRALARWSEPRQLALERVDRLSEELTAVGQIDLAMLSVATNELRTLV